MTPHQRRHGDGDREAVLRRIRRAARQLAFGAYPDTLNKLTDWAEMLEYRVEWQREAFQKFGGAR